MNTTVEHLGTDPGNAVPDFPATKIVHCPNGAVSSCDHHATRIERLMGFLGAHVGITDAPEGSQCENCVNEHLKGKS